MESGETANEPDYPASPSNDRSDNDVRYLTLGRQIRVVPLTHTLGVKVTLGVRLFAFNIIIGYFLINYIFPSAWIHIVCK
jgi:hypothetical protein